MALTLIQFWQFTDSENSLARQLTLFGFLQMSVWVILTSLRTSQWVSLIWLCDWFTLILVVAWKIKNKVGGTNFWFWALAGSISAKIVVAFVWGIIMGQSAPWINLVCDFGFISCMVYVQKIFFKQVVDGIERH